MVSPWDGPTMGPALPTNGLSSGLHCCIMKSSPHVLFPFNVFSRILSSAFEEPRKGGSESRREGP